MVTAAGRHHGGAGGVGGATIPHGYEIHQIYQRPVAAPGHSSAADMIAYPVTTHNGYDETNGTYS